MSYGRYGGEGSRDFNRGFAPKPVEIGKEYEVDVTCVGQQTGRWYCTSPRICYFRQEWHGQKIKVRVNQVGARFATATTVASPAP